MANFEEDIKKITDEILQDGTVDKIIRENIIKGFEIKKEQERSWSCFDRAVLEFSVAEEEQQENLNRTIRLDHYKNGAEGWDIIAEINPEITSLRHLDDFDILLIRLSKGMVKLIIDEESDWDNVISENEPEAKYE